MSWCSGAPPTIRTSAPWTGTRCCPSSATSAPTSATPNSTSSPRRPTAVCCPPWPPPPRPPGSEPDPPNPRTRPHGQVRGPVPDRGPRRHPAAHRDHLPHQQSHHRDVRAAPAPGLRPALRSRGGPGRGQRHRRPAGRRWPPRASVPCAGWTATRRRRASGPRPPPSGPCGRATPDAAGCCGSCCWSSPRCSPPVRAGSSAWAPAPPEQFPRWRTRPWPRPSSCSAPPASSPPPRTSSTTTSRRGSWSVRNPKRERSSGSSSRCPWPSPRAPSCSRCRRLTGKTLDEAKTALNGAEMALGKITETFDETAAAGTVLAQAPRQRHGRASTAPRWA